MLASKGNSVCYRNLRVVMAARPPATSQLLPILTPLALHPYRLLPSEKKYSGYTTLIEMPTMQFITFIINLSFMRQKNENAKFLWRDRLRRKTFVFSFSEADILEKDSVLLA